MIDREVLVLLLVVVVVVGVACGRCDQWRATLALKEAPVRGSLEPRSRQSRLPCS